MYQRTKEQLITAPTIDPVSTADARKHCNVTTNDDDGYLCDLVTAARMNLEEVCWSSFITQTWQYWFNGFGSRMFIPRPPLQSVTFVKYTDGNGDLQTVDSSVYEISSNLGFWFVGLQHGQSWPSPRGHRDDVTVQVVSGYGDTALDVPMPLRQAMKLLVGNMYRIRGDEPPQEVPAAVQGLIAPYRIKET